MKFGQQTIKVTSIAMFVGALLLHLACFITASAQSFSFSGTTRRNTIDFKLIKNLIVIPITVNGKGPYNFLLDTGVGPLIITEPSMVDTLGLKVLRTTKIYGLGKGEEIEAFLSSEINLQIKDASIQHIPTAILKTDIFNLSSYLGLKIHGIIGYYFFNSFVVKVNYSTNRLAFYNPENKVKKRGNKFPIELINNRPYIMANLTTDKKEAMNVKLLVDCGASHALSMQAFNKMAFPLPDSSITANLGVGLNGLIDGHVGRISAFSLGKYKFKNMISSFPAFESVASKTGYTTQDGNLGADFLRRFDITYDYLQNSIYLKANGYFKEPFEHDMSGLEIYVDNGRFLVSRIEPGSPADKAGFKENDEFLSINLKITEYYTLDEITKLFKSKDGQTIVIELARNNKSVVKLLKLKKRI
ncbi:MAG: peptide-binding protein [Pedobacter sp.]|nr:MAG: peptide-binding protein [Pedobacter sp.]